MSQLRQTLRNLPLVVTLVSMYCLFCGDELLLIGTRYRPARLNQPESGTIGLEKVRHHKI
jgi:hypothetical protein